MALGAGEGLTAGDGAGGLYPAVPPANLGDGLRRHRGHRGPEESQRDRTGGWTEAAWAQGKEEEEGPMGSRG